MSIILIDRSNLISVIVLFCGSIHSTLVLVTAALALKSTRHSRTAVLPGLNVTVSADGTRDMFTTLIMDEDDAQCTSSSSSSMAVTSRPQMNGEDELDNDGKLECIDRLDLNRTGVIAGRSLSSSTIFFDAELVDTVWN